MTNEQVAVLLNGIGERLSRAIEDAEQKLPEELWKETENPFGFKVERIPELDELKSLERELRAEINTLLGRDA